MIIINRKKDHKSKWKKQSFYQEQLEIVSFENEMSKEYLEKRIDNKYKLFVNLQQGEMYIWKKWKYK
jgi:hypothetical protein